MIVPIASGLALASDPFGQWARYWARDGGPQQTQPLAARNRGSGQRFREVVSLI
jgi:hypothetical protein